MYFLEMQYDSFIELFYCYTDPDLVLLGLIETANWNLRRMSRLDKVAIEKNKVQKSSDSPSESCLEKVAPEISNGDISNGNQHDILEVVSFRRENFVESTSKFSEQYDTIVW